MTFSTCEIETFAENLAKINATVQNRKILRVHAKEAMRAYSPIMTWLLLDSKGNLHILSEPQGHSFYNGNDIVIATTGGFHKIHGNGNGAVTDEWGYKYTSQRAYLKDLLENEYDRIFEKMKAK